MHRVLFLESVAQRRSEPNGTRSSLKTGSSQSGGASLAPSSGQEQLQKALSFYRQQTLLDLAGIHSSNATSTDSVPAATSAEAAAAGAAIVGAEAGTTVGRAVPDASVALLESVKRDFAAYWSTSIGLANASWSRRVNHAVEQAERGAARATSSDILSRFSVALSIMLNRLHSVAAAADSEELSSEACSVCHFLLHLAVWALQADGLHRLPAVVGSPCGPLVATLLSHAVSTLPAPWWPTHSVHWETDDDALRPELTEAGIRVFLAQALVALMRSSLRVVSSVPSVASTRAASVLLLSASSLAGLSKGPGAVAAAFASFQTLRGQLGGRQSRSVSIEQEPSRSMSRHPLAAPSDATESPMARALSLKRDHGLPPPVSMSQGGGSGESVSTTALPRPSTDVEEPPIVEQGPLARVRARGLALAQRMGGTMIEQSRSATKLASASVSAFLEALPPVQPAPLLPALPTDCFDDLEPHRGAKETSRLFAIEIDSLLCVSLGISLPDARTVRTISRDGWSHTVAITDGGKLAHRASSSTELSELTNKPFLTIAVDPANSTWVALSAEGGVYSWGDNWVAEGEAVGDRSLRDRVLARSLSQHSQEEKHQSPPNSVLQPLHELALDGLRWAEGVASLSRDDDATQLVLQSALREAGFNESLRRIPTSLCAVRLVACGPMHAMFVCKDGRMLGVGRNSNGALGTGDLWDRSRPSFVLPFGSTGVHEEEGTSRSASTVTSIACGAHHTVVCLSDGTCFSTGRNDWGQCGHALPRLSHTFSRIRGQALGRSIVQVACGSFTSLMVDAEGSLLGCGKNDAGQLGPIEWDVVGEVLEITVTSDAVSHVACSEEHSLVLSKTGAVWLLGHREAAEGRMHLLPSDVLPPGSLVVDGWIDPNAKRIVLRSMHKAPARSDPLASIVSRLVSLAEGSIPQSDDVSAIAAWKTLEASGSVSVSQPESRRSAPNPLALSPVRRLPVSTLSSLAMSASWSVATTPVAVSNTSHTLELLAAAMLHRADRPPSKQLAFPDMEKILTSTRIESQEIETLGSTAAEQIRGLCIEPLSAADLARKLPGIAALPSALHTHLCAAYAPMSMVEHASTLLRNALSMGCAQLIDGKEVSPGVLGFLLGSLSLVLSQLETDSLILSLTVLPEGEAIPVASLSQWFDCGLAPEACAEWVLGGSAELPRGKTTGDLMWKTLLAETRSRIEVLFGIEVRRRFVDVAKLLWVCTAASSAAQTMEQKSKGKDALTLSRQVQEVAAKLSARLIVVLAGETCVDLPAWIADGIGRASRQDISSSLYWWTHLECITTHLADPKELASLLRTVRRRVMREMYEAPSSILMSRLINGSGMNHVLGGFASALVLADKFGARCEASGSEEVARAARAARESAQRFIESVIHGVFAEPLDSGVVCSNWTKITLEAAKYLSRGDESAVSGEALQAVIAAGEDSADIVMVPPPVAEFAKPAPSSASRLESFVSSVLRVGALEFLLGQVTRSAATLVGLSPSAPGRKFSQSSLALVLLYASEVFKQQQTGVCLVPSVVRACATVLRASAQLVRERSRVSQYDTSSVDGLCLGLLSIVQDSLDGLRAVGERPLSRLAERYAQLLSFPGDRTTEELGKPFEEAHAGGPLGLISSWGLDLMQAASILSLVHSDPALHRAVASHMSAPALKSGLSPLALRGMAQSSQSLALRSLEYCCEDFLLLVRADASQPVAASTDDSSDVLDASQFRQSVGLLPFEPRVDPPVDVMGWSGNALSERVRRARFFEDLFRGQNTAGAFASRVSSELASSSFPYRASTMQGRQPRGRESKWESDASAMWFAERCVAGASLYLSGFDVEAAAICEAATTATALTTMGRGEMSPSWKGDAVSPARIGSPMSLTPMSVSRAASAGEATPGSVMSTAATVGNRSTSTVASRLVQASNAARYAATTAAYLPATIVQAWIPAARTRIRLSELRRALATDKDTALAKWPSSNALAKAGAPLSVVGVSDLLPWVCSLVAERARFMLDLHRPDASSRGLRFGRFSLQSCEASPAKRRWWKIATLVSVSSRWKALAQVGRSLSDPVVGRAGLTPPDWAREATLACSTKWDSTVEAYSLGAIRDVAIRVGLAMQIDSATALSDTSASLARFTEAFPNASALLRDVPVSPTVATMRACLSSLAIESSATFLLHQSIVALTRTAKSDATRDAVEEMFSDLTRASPSAVKVPDRGGDAEVLSSGSWIHRAMLWALFDRPPSSSASVRSLVPHESGAKAIVLVIQLATAQLRRALKGSDANRADAAVLLLSTLLDTVFQQTHDLADTAQQLHALGLHKALESALLAARGSVRRQPREFHVARCFSTLARATPMFDPTLRRLSEEAVLASSAEEALPHECDLSMGPTSQIVGGGCILLPSPCEFRPHSPGIVLPVGRALGFVPMVDEASSQLSLLLWVNPSAAGDRRSGSSQHLVRIVFGAKSAVIVYLEPKAGRVVCEFRQQQLPVPDPIVQESGPADGSEQCVLMLRSGASLAMNRWSHIAVCANSKRAHLFVNGHLQTSGAPVNKVTLGFQGLSDSTAVIGSLPPAEIASKWKAIPPGLPFRSPAAIGRALAQIGNSLVICPPSGATQLKPDHVRSPLGDWAPFTGQMVNLRILPREISGVHVAGMKGFGPGEAVCETCRVRANIPFGVVPPQCLFAIECVSARPETGGEWFPCVFQGLLSDPSPHAAVLWAMALPQVLGHATERLCAAALGASIEGAEEPAGAAVIERLLYTARALNPLAQLTSDCSSSSKDMPADEVFSLASVRSVHAHPAPPSAAPLCPVACQAHPAISPLVRQAIFIALRRLLLGEEGYMRGCCERVLSSTLSRCVGSTDPLVCLLSCDTLVACGAPELWAPLAEFVMVPSSQLSRHLSVRFPWPAVPCRLSRATGGDYFLQALVPMSLFASEYRKSAPTDLLRCRIAASMAESLWRLPEGAMAASVHGCLCDVWDLLWAEPVLSHGEASDSLLTSGIACSLVQGTFGMWTEVERLLLPPPKPHEWNPSFDLEPLPLEYGVPSITGYLCQVLACLDELYEEALDPRAFAMAQLLRRGSDSETLTSGVVAESQIATSGEPEEHDGGPGASRSQLDSLDSTPAREAASRRPFSAAVSRRAALQSTRSSRILDAARVVEVDVASGHGPEGEVLVGMRADGGAADGAEEPAALRSHHEADDDVIVTVERMEQLAAMGYPRTWCEIALQLCGGNILVASEWLVDNADEIAILEAHGALDQASQNLRRLMRTEAPDSRLSSEAEAAEAAAEDGQSSSDGAASVLEMSPDLDDATPRTPHDDAGEADQEMGNGHADAEDDDEESRVEDILGSVSALIWQSSSPADGASSQLQVVGFTLHANRMPNELDTSEAARQEHPGAAARVEEEVVPPVAAHRGHRVSGYDGSDAAVEALQRRRDLVAVRGGPTMQLRGKQQLVAGGRDSPSPDLDAGPSSPDALHQASRVTVEGTLMHNNSIEHLESLLEPSVQDSDGAEVWNHSSSVLLAPPGAGPADSRTLGLDAMSSLDPEAMGSGSATLDAQPHSPANRDRWREGDEEEGDEEDEQGARTPLAKPKSRKEAVNDDDFDDEELFQITQRAQRRNQEDPSLDGLVGEWDPASVVDTPAVLMPVAIANGELVPVLAQCDVDGPTPTGSDPVFLPERVAEPILDEGGGLYVRIGGRLAGEGDASVDEFEDDAHRERRRMCAQAVMTETFFPSTVGEWGLAGYLGLSSSQIDTVGATRPPRDTDPPHWLLPRGSHSPRAAVCRAWQILESIQLDVMPTRFDFSHVHINDQIDWSEDTPLQSLVVRWLRTVLGLLAATFPRSGPWDGAAWRQQLLRSEGLSCEAEQSSLLQLASMRTLGVPGGIAPLLACWYIPLSGHNASLEYNRVNMDSAMHRSQNALLLSLHGLRTVVNRKWTLFGSPEPCEMDKVIQFLNVGCFRFGQFNHPDGVVLDDPSRSFLWKIAAWSLRSWRNHFDLVRWVIETLKDASGGVFGRWHWGASGADASSFVSSSTGNSKSILRSVSLRHSIRTDAMVARERDSLRELDDMTADEPKGGGNPTDAAVLSCRAVPDAVAMATPRAEVAAAMLRCLLAAASLCESSDSAREAVDNPGGVWGNLTLRELSALMDVPSAPIACVAAGAFATVLEQWCRDREQAIALDEAVAARRVQFKLVGLPVMWLQRKVRLRMEAERSEGRMFFSPASTALVAAFAAAQHWEQLESAPIHRFLVGEEPSTPILAAVDEALDLPVLPPTVLLPREGLSVEERARLQEAMQPPKLQTLSVVDVSANSVCLAWDPVSDLTDHDYVHPRRGVGVTPGVYYELIMRRTLLHPCQRGMLSEASAASSVDGDPRIDAFDIEGMDVVVTGDGVEGCCWRPTVLPGGAVSGELLDAELQHSTTSAEHNGHRDSGWRLLYRGRQPRVTVQRLVPDSGYLVRWRAVRLMDETYLVPTQWSKPQAMRTSRSSSFGWDLDNSGTGVRFSKDGLTVQHLQDEHWTLVLGSACLTRGRNRWSVKIESTPNEYLFVGVASAAANPEAFLGADEHGWGWMGGRTTYHRRHPQDPYGVFFSTGDVIGVSLDLDLGTLSFTHNGTPMGKAYSGVGGELYPAVAFFSRGQAVSILPESVWVPGQHIPVPTTPGLVEVTEAVETLREWRRLGRPDTILPNGSNAMVFAGAWSSMLRWLKGWERRFPLLCSYDATMDVSPAACSSFGVREMDRILTSQGEGTAYGVLDGRLWIHMEGEAGAWSVGGRPLRPCGCTVSRAAACTSSTGLVHPALAAAGARGLEATAACSGMSLSEVVCEGGHTDEAASRGRWNIIMLVSSRSSQSTGESRRQAQSASLAPAGAECTTELCVAPCLPGAPVWSSLRRQWGGPLVRKGSKWVELGTGAIMSSLPWTSAACEFGSSSIHFSSFVQTALDEAGFWAQIGDEALVEAAAEVASRQRASVWNVPPDDIARIAHDIISPLYEQWGHRAEDVTLPSLCRFAYLRALCERVTRVLSLLDSADPITQCTVEHPVGDEWTAVPEASPACARVPTPSRPPSFESVMQGMREMAGAPSAGGQTPLASSLLAPLLHSSEEQCVRELFRWPNTECSDIPIRRVMFRSLKLQVVAAILERTATRLSRPADEYDLPPELPVVYLNRALSLTRMGCADPLLKLQHSIFGQMLGKLHSLPDVTLRITYNHSMDDGQLRSFRVRFRGEGSDDYGGPYREAIVAAVENLQQPLFNAAAGSVRSLAGVILPFVHLAVAAKGSPQSRVTHAVVIEALSAWIRDLAVDGLSVPIDSTASLTTASFQRAVRAVIHRFIGDSAEGENDPPQACALPLFLPCPNARHAVGENRDGFVLHPNPGAQVACETLALMGLAKGVATRLAPAGETGADELPSLVNYPESRLRAAIGDCFAALGQDEAILPVQSWASHGGLPEAMVMCAAHALGLTPPTVPTPVPFNHLPLQPPPVLAEALCFLGKLIGMCIRTHVLIPLFLSKLSVKLIVGEVPTRADLRAIDLGFVRTLEAIERAAESATEADLPLEGFEDLRWVTELSDGTRVELCPDGESKPVLVKEAAAFVARAEHVRLYEGQQAAHCIRRGLIQIVPATCLAMVSAHDVLQVLCGDDDVDVALLRRNTDYEGHLPGEDPTVETFWRVLEEFSRQDKRKFLQFVSARTRLPSTSSSLPQRFKLQLTSSDTPDASQDGQLPHAHTCFMSLSLPRYSSETVMRERLLVAIHSCISIDGDFALNEDEGGAAWAHL
jgi:hypothetical protein